MALSAPARLELVPSTRTRYALISNTIRSLTSPLFNRTLPARPSSLKLTTKLELCRLGHWKPSASEPIAAVKPRGPHRSSFPSGTMAPTSTKVPRMMLSVPYAHDAPSPETSAPIDAVAITHIGSTALHVSIPRPPTRP